jgi:quercetin dioxygenase-like cupin family protein
MASPPKVKAPRTVFFNMTEDSGDAKVAPDDPDPTGMSRPAQLGEYFRGRANGRKVMVSNPDTDGMSLTIFKFGPGTVLPRHRHDVDYIEFVLEGEVHHGNRILGAGEGVFREAGSLYTFWAGPEGATIADFRAHTFYRTEYMDPPEKWPAHKDV